MPSREGEGDMNKAILGVVAAVAIVGVAVAADEGRAAMTTAEPISRNEKLNKNLEKQVEPTLKAFEADWNKHDPKTMASHFAKDAVLINPSGRLARGREEIQKLFEDEQSGMLKGTQFSSRVVDVKELAPKVAFVDMEITVSGMKDQRGMALPDLQVHGVMVLTNMGGKWQISEGRPYSFAPAPSQMGVGGSGVKDTQQMQNVPPGSEMERQGEDVQQERNIGDAPVKQ